MECVGQFHTPIALPPGKKPWYPWYIGLLNVLQEEDATMWWVSCEQEFVTTSLNKVEVNSEVGSVRLLRNAGKFLLDY